MKRTNLPDWCIKIFGEKIFYSSPFKGDVVFIPSIQFLVSVCSIGNVKFSFDLVAKTRFIQQDPFSLLLTRFSLSQLEAEGVPRKRQRNSHVLASWRLLLEHREKSAPRFVIFFFSRVLAQFVLHFLRTSLHHMTIDRVQRPRRGGGENQFVNFV